jgi:hypothetical protein
MLTKVVSDAGYKTAMAFAKKEIDTPSVVPSFFEGAAESGLESHAAIVRAFSDAIATAVLAAAGFQGQAQEAVQGQAQGQQLPNAEMSAPHLGTNAP